MKNLLFTALLSLLALGSALAQQVRTVPAFHAIKLSGGIALDLTAGATQRVEVSTEPAELAQYLTTTVDNGTLVLRFEHPGGNVRSQRLRVAVTAEQLTSIVAGGGSVVKATGAFAAPALALEASSGSVVTAALGVRELTVSAHGGSVVKLSAKETLTATAEGGSSIKYHGSPRVTTHVGGGSTIKGS